MSISYNSPAKQASREKFGSFLDAYVLPYHRPEDITVLCLPGATVKGEEALEVKQVYDPRGIQRSNITGLERDEIVYGRLRAAHLGMRIVKSNVLGFLRQRDKPFTIINLDYCGQQNPVQDVELRYIAAKGLLQDHGALATVYSAQRESKTNKLRYAWGDFEHRLLQKGSSPIPTYTIDDLINDFQRELDNSEGVKRESITYKILSSLGEGRLSGNSLIDLTRFRPQIFDLWPEYREKADEVLRSSQVQEASEKFIKYLRSLSSSNLQIPTCEDIEYFPQVLQFMENGVVEWLFRNLCSRYMREFGLAYAETLSSKEIDYFTKDIYHFSHSDLSGLSKRERYMIKVMNTNTKAAVEIESLRRKNPRGYRRIIAGLSFMPWFSRILINRTHFYQRRGYSVPYMERYSYTGNRTKMFMDLIAIENCDRIAAAIDPIITLTETPIFNPQKLEPSDLGRYIADFEELALRGFPQIPDRVHLGSSSSQINLIPSDPLEEESVVVSSNENCSTCNMPKGRHVEKEKITEDEAVFLLKDGFLPQKIAREFNGFTIKQLIGIKSKSGL